MRSPTPAEIREAVRFFVAAFRRAVETVKTLWRLLRRAVIEAVRWLRSAAKTLAWFAQIRRERMRAVHRAYRSKHRYPTRRACPA